MKISAMGSMDAKMNLRRMSMKDVFLFLACLLCVLLQRSQ
jgi:hypothetical protein